MARGRVRGRGRGGAPPPTLFVSPAAISTVVTGSRDARRVRTSTTAVTTSSNTPIHFEEDPFTSAAIEASDFSYTLGDNTLDAEVDDPVHDGIEVILPARRNENSVSRRYKSS